MTTPIDTTLVPARVRNAGPQAVDLYGAALQFEQLLTQQLAQGLVPDDSASSDGSGDDGASSSDSGLGAYQGLLPDALAQSVGSAGGTGLALELYRSLGGKEAKSA